MNYFEITCDATKITHLIFSLQGHVSLISSF